MIISHVTYTIAMDKDFNSNTFQGKNELFNHDDHHSEQASSSDEADNTAQDLSDDKEDSGANTTSSCFFEHTIFEARIR